MTAFTSPWNGTLVVPDPNTVVALQAAAAGD
jgi:hypothetical protein